VNTTINRYRRWATTIASRTTKYEIALRYYLVTVSEASMIKFQLL